MGDAGLLGDVADPAVVEAAARDTRTAASRRSRRFSSCAIDRSVKARP
jgi:hypothetical protein